VHERPAGITTSELAAVLLGQWQLTAAELRYLPVGFGGYHWLAVDPAGSRWFVTVSDVGAGDGFADLAAAMETAAWLASDAGLDFVLAPVRAQAGPSVSRLASRYAVTVFPFAAGVPGSFVDQMDGAGRAAVIDMLAALHGVSLDGGAPGAVPVLQPELGSRAAVSTALADLDVPWQGGPFAEPGRELLAKYAPVLRQSLARFDALVARVRQAGRPLVITHGEPHPGNLVWSGPAAAGQQEGTPPPVRLVDWDTVGLALPERDLWWLVTDDDQEAARYAERTGRTVSPDAIALYRLRWSLDDICLFLAEFRAPHQRTPDTEKSWAGLRTRLSDLPTG
jgi:spectinomycin phosphotransferase